jgi:iron-sulfur cluster assembly protein
MLTLTPSAVEAVDTLLHSSPEVPDEAGLRIGSAGEAQLTIGIAPEPAPGDQVIEEGGARVFVDSAAAQLLDNAQLTAQMDGNEVAFGLSQAASENGSPPA